MLSFFLLDTTIWMEIFKYAPALAVALGLGVPTFNWQRKQIDDARKSLENANKAHLAQVHELNLAHGTALQRRDDKIFEIATKTQEALKDLTGLISHMETRNLSTDTELRVQMSNVTSAISKLTTVLETTIKYIDRVGPNN